MTDTHPRRIPFARLDPDLADEIVVSALTLQGHPETRPAGATACRWCGHAWHGTPCSTDASNKSACRCDSSFTCRDDSWRPRYGGSWVYRAERWMDVTGVDGYTAKWLTAVPGTNMPYAVRQHRLRAAVLQGGPLP